LERIPYGQNWYVGFHPLDGNTMFHSGESMDFSGFIFRSADGGNSWSAYSTFDDYGDNCVHSIAFHPTNPHILVYSGEGIIGKSTDKGETWKMINRPDFTVNGAWYEHEGYDTGKDLTNPDKRADTFSKMMNRGIKQSDRLIFA